MRLVDLVGKKFNALEVVSRNGSDCGGHPQWLCRCECGKETSVLGADLKRGSTKSCGCLKTKANGDAHRTHGLSGIPEYRTWRMMILRCSVPSAKGYKNYGGRGISVCERWLASTSDFIKDMGPKPFPEAEIDRIDVNGNYEPSNCRWLSKKENLRNMRKSRLVKYRGKTICCSAWAELFGLKGYTVANRIANGWSPHRALNTPVGGSK